MKLEVVPAASKYRIQSQFAGRRVSAESRKETVKRNPETMSEERRPWLRPQRRPPPESRLTLPVFFKNTSAASDGVLGEFWSIARGSAELAT